MHLDEAMGGQAFDLAGQCAQGVGLIVLVAVGGGQGGSFRSGGGGYSPPGAVGTGQRTGVWL